ncbi:MAG: helix-turn-helix domain-containing protein [Planctomycetes bacterium]|nr:helix-turn-helix domain-containing protein [Planctomycetota bacterium]
MADFFSFDEVLKELKIAEDELKRMVSEGEIRAFRSENKMKFKKEDIEKIRQDPVKGSTSSVEDTVKGASGGQTDDILVEELVEGSNFETDLLQEVPEETPVAGSTDVSGLELEETTQLEEEQTLQPEKRSSRSAPSFRRPVVIQEQKSPILWVIVLFLTTVVLAYASVVVFEGIFYEKHTSNKPVVSKGAVEWFLEKFWSDPEWKKHHEARLEKDGSGKILLPSKIMGYKIDISKQNLFQN